MGGPIKVGSRLYLLCFVILSLVSLISLSISLSAECFWLLYSFFLVSLLCLSISLSAKRFSFSYSFCLFSLISLSLSLSSERLLCSIILFCSFFLFSCFRFSLPM